MVITVKELLAAGAHYGHRKSRWHPKAKENILAEKNGIHVIDLRKTVDYINKAYNEVVKVVSKGGTVLFVGTKEQSREIIAQEAQRSGQPYVNYRWLGGLLTNFATVHKRLQRLKELEAIDYTGGTGEWTKKELLILSREKNKLERYLGGVRRMDKTPSLIWIIDAKKEAIAIKEAKSLNIPVIGLSDTNIDPNILDFPIPCNDDSITTIKLLTQLIADAVAKGVMNRSEGGEVVKDASEPLAEWEKELLNSANKEN